MTHRYRQVLLTYLRRRPLWLYLGGWIGTLLLLGVLPEWMDRPMQFIFLALAATGPAALIGHAKEQMADARASLVPDFRTPHVVVAVALSLATLVGLPLVSYRLLDASPLGLLATTALAAAGFATIAYFQSWRAIFGCIAATSLLVINQVRDAGQAMLADEATALASATLAAATGVFTVIFYRLAALREGMPEYARLLGGVGEARGGAPPDAAAPGEPSLLSRLQLAAVDYRLKRIRNVAGSGLRRRVRHWMLSGETSGTKWPAALVIALMITAMPVITDDDKPDAGAAAIAFVCSLVMPLFATAATWMPRRRSLGYESTRPVARDRFVREFGLAMAADLFEWWAWLTLAAAVPLFVWAPHVRLDVVLPVVVLAAAEQVLAFGILVHVLRLRSADASEGSVMMSLCAVVMPLLIALNVPIKSAGVTLTIATGVALLGAALVYDGYRRWCEADLA